MRVEARSGRAVDRRHQRRALGCEPAQRFALVSEVFRDDARLGWAEDDQVPGQKQQAVGRVRGVQVVVEYPAERGVPVAVGLDTVGEFGGVGAEQVVEGVPAGGVLREQPGADQLGH